MSKSIKRLEQVLCAWLDECFLARTMATVQAVFPEQQKPADVIPLMGFIRHSQGLRSHLLSLRKLEDFDVARFLLPTEISQLLPNSFSWFRVMSMFPLALASWTCNSRRVYQITDELQLLLGVTSLGDVRWSDVSWPFESFVVSLSIPIKDAHNTEYDCMLVSQIPNLVNDEKGKMLAIYLLPAGLTDQRIVSPKKHEQILTLVQRKRWYELVEVLEQHEKGRPPVPVISNFFIKMDENRSVIDSIEEVSCGTKIITENHPEWNMAAQLIVGFCLYLTTLPPGPSSDRSDWKPSDKTMGLPDPSAITDGSQICTISTVMEINKEDRDRIGLGDSRGRTFHELCAHFRAGQWRRRPGFGHDPLAPKTVRVKPALIRKDRVPNGALPGGSEHIVG